MGMMLRTVRNVLILNVCVFLPLLAAFFGFAPERLEIAMETDRPLSVGVGIVSQESTDVDYRRVAGCPVGKNVEPLRFDFADGCDVRNLRLRFTGERPCFRIKSVSVLRHFLFRSKLPLSEFRAGFLFDEDVSITAESDGTLFFSCAGHEFRGGANAQHELKFDFPQLEMTKIWTRGGVMICALQLLFLVAAFLGAWRCPQIELRSNLGATLMVAATFALFFGVIVPWQSVASNRILFDFPAVEIVQTLGICLIELFVVSFLLLYLATIGFARVPHVLLLAFTFYEYLQTGILSSGYPSLDGSMAFYMDLSNGKMDLLFLGLLFIGFGVAYKFVRNWLGWICMGIVAMSVASLFDVRQEKRSVHADGPWDFTRTEVAKAIRFSSKRNVIMLVLDATQSDVTYDVLSHDDLLRSQFEGFYAFNNNIGMHEYTTLGVPGLLTGQYCDNGIPHREFVKNSWATNSFAMTYATSGAAVYVLPGLKNRAFTNRKTANCERTMERLSKTGILYRRSKENPPLCLMDFLRFRLTPFPLKNRVLALSFLGLIGADGTGEERSLYPMFANASVTSEDDLTLVKLHTNGCHPPICFDREGNRAYRPPTYDTMYEQSWFVLKCVGGFLNTLRDKGIYDQSMIIIAADHGSSVAPVRWRHLANIPSRAIPMLWIKPAGSHTEFAPEMLPTSHSKICQLVVKAKDHDLSIDEIRNILKTEMRHYRHGRTEKLEDWWIDAAGRSTKKGI